MKKVLFALLLLGGFTTASAQDYIDPEESVALISEEKEDAAAVTEPEQTNYKKFFNISFVSEKLKPSDGKFQLKDEMENVIENRNVGLKNDWGVSIVRARTFNLHKKPLAGMIRIGLDVCFMDFSYSMFTATVGNDYNGGYNEGYEPYYNNEGTGGYGQEATSKEKLHKIDYSLHVGPSITVTPIKDLSVTAYFRYAPTFSSFYYNESYLGNYASYFLTGANVNYKRIGLGMESRVGQCKYKNFVGDLDLQGMKVKSTGFRVYFQVRW